VCLVVTGCGTEPEVKPLIMEYFLFEIVKENFVVVVREENGQIVAFGMFLGKGQTLPFLPDVSTYRVEPYDGRLEN